MLPRFADSRVALAPEGLKYNPCNDLIFPSVFHAGAHLKRPLAEFYLYYAPHDAPGGICLATSNDLNGPWKEFDRNPLITRDWPPHYTVSHVSSPHALWMADESQMYLYFHGENDTTRLATSTDGITFDYVDAVVTTAKYEGISEASYARVFPCTARPGKRFAMLFMGNNGGTRRIYAAWSADGRHFEAQPKPLINPPPGTGVNQCGGPFYLPVDGRNIVLFHGDQMDATRWNELHSDIYATDVGPAFDEETHLGLFYPRTAIGPDNHRASDPYVFEHAGRRWLFAAGGTRLTQYITVASEV